MDNLKINKNKLKELFEKFWFIVWKDDSFKGWIISIIFIFIVIKLIFFPLLSFATGTSLPLAIVESCSMYHQDNFLSNFDNWWDSQHTKYNQFNITKEQFEKFSFKKGFNKGDILFIIKADPKKLKVGDVIIFNANRKNPLIHRIISIKQMPNEKIFSTMGDNNNGQLSIEKEIHENQLIGKAMFRLVPYAGWGKLIFFEYRQPDYNKGFC